MYIQEAFHTARYIGWKEKKCRAFFLYYGVIGNTLKSFGAKHSVLELLPPQTSG